MIDLETAGVMEIAEYFSHEVNQFLFTPQEIAEGQKGSKQMKDLDICWIKIVASPVYRTDLRNEASAKVGRQLAGIPFIRKKMELVNNPKMEEVAEKMATDHRTLQQVFSGLIYCHLLWSCNKSEAQAILKVMGDSYYRLPLI